MHEQLYIGPGMALFNPKGHIKNNASVLSANRQLLAGSGFMIEIKAVAVVNRLRKKGLLARL